MAEDHHVVVIGAGFGGLECVRRLAGSGARVTLVDRRNHHLFQPLLYQVATTILSPAEIAWPIRALVRGRPDVTTLLAEVTGIEGKSVILDDGSRIAFDTLVIATGARHAYFGHAEWEPFAPGLKTIEDATEIRRRLLLALELAERTDDPALREALMTFVIIGGGPTGVELAGIIAELTHVTLRHDFRRINPHKSRVILIEAGDRLLTAFPPDLSAYAARALERQGVTLSFGKAVTACSDTGVHVGQDVIPCRTIVWAAGVAASPAARWLDLAPDRAGRVTVTPDLTVPGRDDVFVIGDTAAVVWDNGRMVPGIAPAAKQMGDHVARTIRAQLSGKPGPGAFRYRHQGNLATIGKRAAVVEMGSLRLTGTVAWWVWGIAHVYFLIGTRSRAAVAWNWLWTYLRGQNTARLIVWPRDRTGLD